MENIRWGIIFGVFSLIISVLLGIFGGVSSVHILIRALIFTVLFFGIGAGLRFIINNFFPELLAVEEDKPEGDDYEQTGTIIDITLGNTGEYAVPELYKDTDEPEMGNIEDLISGAYKSRRGIDRNEEEEYNDMKGDPDSDNFTIPQPINRAEVPLVKPVITPTFGNDSDGSEDLGGLPDLDVLARVFSPAYTSGSASASSASVPFAPEPSMPVMLEPVEEEEAVQYYKGNKPQPLSGDFNPKELAEGIRTVLAKDK